jgi:hypothetical protein
MAGWQCLIGGQMAQGGIVVGNFLDYSAYVDFPSVRIFLTNRQRGSHATMKMTITNKAITRPKAFQMVTVINLNNNTNLFAGIIQIVDQDEVNATTYEYTLTCSDLTRWLDHFPAGIVRQYPLVATDTLDITVKNIILDWVNPGTQVPQSYGPAQPFVPVYTNTHVKTVGVTLLYYNPSFIPVSQAIDYLARIGNCVWFIDANADLWFVPATDASLYAPIDTLTSVTFYDQQQRLNVSYTNFPVLDADNDALIPPYNYRDLKLTEDGSTSISAVLVRGFQESGTVFATESPTSTTDANVRLVGDGVSTTFGLNLVPVNNVTTTTPASYMTVTATINGSVITYNSINANIKIEYVDGQPSDVNTPTNLCYINTAGQSIRFNGPTKGRKSGEGVGAGTGAYGAPDYGTNITVVYYYYIPGYWPQFLPSGSGTPISTVIQGRENYGGGIYMDLISDSSLTTPISLNDGTPQWLAAVNLDFARYGLLRLQARFHSRITGWYPGQVFAITSVNRGDTVDNADTGFTGWGTTFTNRFFVNEVNISIVNDTSIDNEIKASSNIWGN